MITNLYLDSFVDVPLLLSIMVFLNQKILQLWNHDVQLNSHPEEQSC